MKISIIVPVYNVEKYIKKCLDSLVNQTLKEIEIILVNDGSHENEETIILKYQKKHPNIVYFKKENGGQASARNYALQKAKGEYVIYVDSDDYIKRDMCEKLYDYATTNDYDIVVADMIQVGETEERYLSKTKYYHEDKAKNYLMNSAGVASILIKTEIASNKELQFLENKIYEDLAVIPAYALFTNKIGFLSEPFYYYLVRSGSTMKQTIYHKKLEDIFDSLEHVRSLFVKHQKENVYQNELEYYYIEHLLHAASLRFFEFQKWEQLNRIIEIIKQYYPNWKKNPYYKKESLKYKIICSLFYQKQYRLLKMLLKGN